jgi:hypothetical protein
VFEEFFEVEGLGGDRAFRSSLYPVRRRFPLRFYGVANKSTVFSPSPAGKRATYFRVAYDLFFGSVLQNVEEVVLEICHSGDVSAYLSAYDDVRSVPLRSTEGR